MNPTAGARALIATLVVGLPALAQSSEPSRAVSWDLGPGSFTRCVAGEFGGDMRQSVVALRSGALHFSYDAGFHTAVSSIAVPEPVSDVATLPALATEDRDSLLVCTDLGLHVAVFSDITREFKFLLVHGSWNNATSLTVREDPSGGGWVFAAVAEDGHTLLVGTRDAAGEFFEAPAPVVGASVTAVELVDWDGDGALESVALAADGIHPYEIDGTAWPMTPTSLTSLASAVVQHPQLGEFLARVTEQNGTHRVRFRNAFVSSNAVIDTSGLQLQGPMLVTGLAAGDMDADGDADLVLSQRASHYAMVLAIAPTKFGSPIALRVKRQTPVPIGPGTGDPTLNHCPVEWHDLDHSSWLDGMTCLDSLPGIAVVYDMDGIAPVVVPPEIIAAATYDGTDLVLSIPASLAGSATELELTFWHQPGPGAFLNAMGTRFTRTLGAPVNGNYEVAVRLQPPGSSASKIIWHNADHYWVDLWFEDPSAEGVTHAETVGLTIRSSENQLPDGELGFMNYLRGRPNLGEGFGDVLIFSPPPPNGQPIMQAVGGIVTRKVPPPFATGSVPAATSG